MEKENYYVTISNEWIYSKEKGMSLIQQHGSESLLIYSIIKRNMTNRGTCVFCFKELCNILQVNTRNNSARTKKLKENILNLDGIIFELYEDSGCTNRTADLKKDVLYIKLLEEKLEGNYFKLDDVAVDKAITIATSNNICTADFVSVIATIYKCMNGNPESEVYSTSQISAEGIARNTMISLSTVKRHIELLVENEVILKGNSGVTFSDGYKDRTNIFAKIGYQEQLEKAVEIDSKKCDYVHRCQTNRDLSNKRRSIKQYINIFRKENNINTIDDLQQGTYDALHALEMEYINTFPEADKIKRGVNLLTVKLDKTIKGFKNNHRDGKDSAIDNSLLEEFLNDDEDEDDIWSDYFGNTSPNSSVSVRNAI